MEFLWVWLFGLKTPISILCGVVILGCFINFLSARASGRGSGSLLTSLHIAIGVAVSWALIYSIPSPDYNVRVVYRDRPVDRPVIRKIVRITGKEVLTQTVRYTQDSRFDYCMDHNSDGNSTEDRLNFCKDWSKQYMEPRVVVQKVGVPVYSGIKTVTMMYSRDARVRWCNTNTNYTLDQCLTFAMKMESPPQVMVKYVHDSYQDIFQKCNDEGQIDVKDPNHIQLRNDRIKICGDLALQASHDH
jgi:hypothetical protein